ncbi:MAG: hypothetical protein AB7O97_04435 [Planctomycetota bacterium]
MQMHSFVKAASVTAALAGLASAQVVVSGDITQSTTFTSNNVYQLSGIVKVLNGATVTIQPGTRFESVPGGALVITRGSQIQALGTELAPIVFTSNLETGAWRPSANEWGNVSLLGQAYISEDVLTIPTNTATFNANNYGIMEGLTGTDATVRYGGGNDDDDSGTIRYTSLRYGGNQPIAPNVELNGLSLGGVGRGTDIHHVEIMNNLDDGIEIWGGTVNFKYISIWNVGDDSFDVDQGWRGKAQFGLIVQGYSLATGGSSGSGVGDNAIETDGAENSDQQPVTTATIYNFTVIGQPDGLDTSVTPPVQRNGADGLTAWRDGARVQYRNCIFMDSGDQLIRPDGNDGDGAQGYGFNGTLSFAQVWSTAFNAVPAHANDPVNPALFYMAQTSGNLAEMKDCVFYNNLAGNAYTEAIARGVTAEPTNVVEPLSMPIQSITRAPFVITGGRFMQQVTQLDPRPANDALTATAYASGDAFFTAANYRGAFAPGNNWLSRWSTSSAYGFLVEDGWVDLGLASEGSTGAPVLSGSGSFAPGSNITLSGSNFGLPAMILAVGTSRIDLPAFGGTVIPNPLQTFFAFGTSLGFGPIPAGLSGFDFYWQAAAFDTTPQGFTLTNGLVKRAL